MKATTDPDGADDIAADDPESVKLMIDYFYDMDYTYSTTSKPLKAAPWDPTIVMHCQVYVLAIRYEVVGLKEAALAKIERRLQFPCAGPDYATPLHVIYKSIPDTEKAMRAAVMNRLLDADIHLLRSEAMQAVVRDIPELAYDLLWVVPETPITGLEDSCSRYHSDGLVVYSCKGCGRRVLMCRHIHEEGGRHRGCSGHSQEGSRRAPVSRVYGTDATSCLTDSSESE